MKERNLIKVKEIFKRYLKENSIKIKEFASILNMKEGTIKSYLYGKKEVSSNFISLFIKLKNLNEKDKEFLQKIYIKQIQKNNINNQFETYIEENIKKNIYENLLYDIKDLLQEYNEKNLFLLDKTMSKIDKSSKKNDLLSIKLRAVEIENPRMREAKIKNKLIKMHEELEKSYSEINFLISESNINNLKGLKSSMIVTISRLENHITNFKKILNLLGDTEEHEIIDI